MAQISSASLAPSNRAGDGFVHIHAGANMVEASKIYMAPLIRIGKAGLQKPVKRSIGLDGERNTLKKNERIILLNML